MAMEQRLQMKLAQKLVMTQNLQLAIKLLQLSKIELTEMLNRELTENPVLEDALLEAPESETDHNTNDQSSPNNPSVTTGVEETDSGTNSEIDPRLKEIDWDTLLSDHHEPVRRFESEDREPVYFENFIGNQTTSLEEHLQWQLDVAGLTNEEAEIGREIIGNLREDGYLRGPLEDIAVRFNLPVARVEDVLYIIQEFDPIGICARDVRECLLLQVWFAGGSGSLLESIIDQHLPLLERKNYPEIAKRESVSVEEIRGAVDELRRLEPKPGRQYDARPIEFITPDVYIEQDNGDYKITLSDEGMPKLRISRLYRRYLAGEDIPPQIKKYVEKKLKNAMWLLKSVDQRQKTIYKVAVSILKFQRGFFDNGIHDLRPLVLRDVAEDIGMHESTVSRVSTNKYIQTPRGLYEIKWFFHSGLSTNNGIDVSSIRVKEIIKTLVEEENQLHPLSDQKIVKSLKEKGISIARRTVAKYRDELNILPSNRRKVY